MEEILVKRFQLRKGALKDAYESAKATFEEQTMDTITAEQTMKRVKGLISRLDAEIKEYTDKSTVHNVVLVEEGLSLQIESEDLCQQIEDALTLVRPKASEVIPEVEVAATTRLPKLQLPTFAGDKLKWTEFWDRFYANIHSKTIGDADKLSYLIGCLNGEALEAVSGLATTNGNYQIAIDTLTRRFGSKDVVVDAHYSELCNLKRAGDDAKSCRATLNDIERHLRVLENLGEPANGNHLRSLILRKFPDRVIHEVHLIGTDNTVAGIRLGLNKILTAMETSATVLTGSGDLNKPGPSGATTEALHVGSRSAFSQDSRPNLQNRKRKGLHFRDIRPQAKKTKRPCLFCKLTNHASADCKRVVAVEEREKKLEGRCLKCLRRNHRTEQCKRKLSCFRCKGPHFQLLCPEPAGMKGISDTLLSENPEASCHVSNDFTFLQTAVAKVRSTDGDVSQVSRILLDSGSQRSYLTKRLADLLKLPIVKTDLLLIYTFGASTPHETASPSAEVIVETKRGITRKVNVNIVPHITDRVPIANVQNTGVDIYADDDSIGEGIDLLIGNDFYCSFMRDKKINIGKNLYLIDTDFGYILSGNAASNEESSILSVTTYCQCHPPNCPYFTEPDLPLRNIDIRFLWSLENIGITDSPKATRHEEAVNKFNESVQFKDNRYEVTWPWTHYPPDLPSNFGLALGRLKSLLRRIDEDSLTEYNNILKQKLELGIIEVVPLQNLDDPGHPGHPIHFLPHHIVKPKGRPGRIVYDASARISGHKSLNECLYSGPYMLEDLTALLLSFRTRRIGITADIEKAFLQVGLHEKDRDVTRFLWLKDSNQEPTEDNLICFRFCRIPFGVISSPFLLTATIKHHMMKSDEGVVRSVANKCYVDNLVTGADTVEEALEVYGKVRTAFNQISMNMRDWTSNSKTLLASVPTQYQHEQDKEVKVLGLSWNTHDDKLRLRWAEDKLSQESPIDTKRKVLRALAGVYDPCGFVCPLVLPMKLLFQRICEQKCKWDNTLPEEIIRSLEQILVSLKDITNVELPRHLGTVPTEPSMVYDLHAFSDASKDAFAGIVYVKVSGEQGMVSFVMAKCHVAQSKDKKEKVNIPRLELLGFLIASRLLKYVKSKLGIPIQKTFLWTDSMVVLGWMRSNKLLPPFVTNRVEEIKKNVPQAVWYYINTKSNPADLATRPEDWEKKKELWFNGPDFLKFDEAHWPEDRLHDNHHNIFFSVGEDLDQNPGIQDQPKNTSEIPDQPNNELMELDEPAQQTETCVSDEITSTIKNLQREHFPEELEGKRTHLARNLDVFLDVDGILRTRGRMGNTAWSYDMKHPILLPRGAEFTKNMIKETHENNYHVGAPHTLSIIRKKYWIPQGKSQVQKVIRQCPRCIKHGGGPYKLPSAPALPTERVTYNTPFTFTGLDYFGPLYVKDPSNSKAKRWVALFTCLTIRAIHLEVVSDMSAEECLLAIRRFTAARNAPKRIYSDNATYFRLTSEVMKQPYCIEKCIEWKFIPQLAPWHGGFYERLVGLVKHCLKRTLDKHLLNDSQLLTVIKEVESVVNSRPLTKVGPELDHVLSPSDFLTLGKCVTTNPSTAETPVAGTQLKVDLIASWKRGLMIIEEFKRMFVSQYLTSLRERSHHDPKQPRVRSHREPHCGDLVQIKADSKNRDNWKVGKIVDLIKGTDGECRVAKVKVDNSIFTRSIGHLYPLEADGTGEGTPGTDAMNEDKREQEISHPGEAELISQGTNPTLNTDKVQNSEDYIPLVMDSNSSKDSVNEPNTSGHGDEPGPCTQSDVADSPPEDVGKKIRGAALRAREKILEWTQHLFARLQ